MLTIIKGVTLIKNLLGNFSIRTRDDAIAWLHLRSIVNSKDIGERLTGEATAHLEEKCSTCEIHESTNGVKVQRIIKKIKVYNETEATKKAMESVEKAELALASAQARLAKAREKAGFTEKESKPYYQIVK